MSISHDFACDLPKKPLKVLDRCQAQFLPKICGPKQRGQLPPLDPLNSVTVLTDIDVSSLRKIKISVHDGWSI